MQGFPPPWSGEPRGKFRNEDEGGRETGSFVHYNNHNEGWERARADLAASAFVAFDWTSRVDLHFARGVCGARRWPDAILDFCCHCHKGLLDVGCVLGRCLEERDSELIGVFLKQREIHEPTRALRLRFRSLTVAVVVSTTFFVVKSHLLPTSSLFTFSHA